MIEESSLMCWGEHSMMGSTCWQSESPWIPYAILLEGFSIDVVNRERLERNIPREIDGNIVRGLPAIGVYFGFPEGYTVFYNFSPLNLRTGEVERLEVFDVRDPKGQSISRTEFVNLTYLGRHASRLKFPDCVQVI